jgi:hypothetical protein
MPLFPKAVAEKEHTVTFNNTFTSIGNYNMPSIDITPTLMT